MLVDGQVGAGVLAGGHDVLLGGQVGAGVLVGGLANEAPD